MFCVMHRKHIIKHNAVVSKGDLSTYPLSGSALAETWQLLDTDL